MEKINTDLLFVRYYCPKHCTCEMHDFSLTQVLLDGTPKCCNCNVPLVYAETMEVEYSFESWLEKNPGTDRFVCTTHGAYEASCSFCNSCEKELPIEREDYIGILVNADWDSLSLDDAETIFKEEQEEKYKKFSNKELTNKMEEYGYLDNE